MFENLLAPWRAKLNMAVAQAACYAIAGIAGAVAAGFGLAALFSWLSTLYGTIPACLIIAGGFVVVALIPLFILMSIQRREDARVAAAAARGADDAMDQSGDAVARAAGGAHGRQEPRARRGCSRRGAIGMGREPVRGGEPDRR